MLAINVEKKELLYTVHGNVNWDSILENSTEVPQNITNRTTLLYSNPTSQYISKGISIISFQRGIYTPAFIAALFTIAKYGNNPMTLYGWMEKENVLYTYNEILKSFKKEGNLVICNNMDEPRRHYTKWNQPVIKRQMLHDLTYLRYIK